MKTILRPAIISVIILAIMSGLNGQNRITVTLQDFTKLAVSGGVHVEIISSNSHEMSIVARDGQPEEVEYEIKKGELKIRAKTDLKQKNEILIKLPYKELTSIEAITGAVINSREDLKGKELYLKALAGGKIELSVDAGKVTAKVSQASDIILYGKTFSQEVYASTGGNYLAYDMACKESDVKAVSGAQIKVKASNKIDATVNSKGFVAYIGEPESTHIESSFGGIIESHKKKPQGEE